MAKQVKDTAPERYNPLGLDIKKVPPTFVNEQGVKWWLLDVGDPQDGIAYRVEHPTNGGDYVVVRSNTVVYADGNLENLLFWFDKERLSRTLSA